LKKILIVLIGMGILLIISSRMLIHFFPLEPTPKPEYSEPYIVEEVVAKPIPVAVKVEPKPKPSYRCDSRQHCSQMKSYDEAKYFNDYCPNTKMDGDGDGIPCERQFRR